MKKSLKFALPMLALLLLLLVFQSVFLIGYVPSESMEPTIKEGSFIFAVRKFDRLKEGDVIVLRRDGAILVKRIIACEGEKVILRGKSVVVPAGTFFVTGDNRAQSYDSEDWDEPFVPREHILAKVIL